jgi:hypothetical protein
MDARPVTASLLIRTPRRAFLIASERQPGQQPRVPERGTWSEGDQEDQVDRPVHGGGARVDRGHRAERDGATLARGIGERSRARAATGAEVVHGRNAAERRARQREGETATDTWRVIEVHPVEICEGAPWLEEGFSTNQLSFSPPNRATDESTVELFRTEEAIRAEERKQAEKGEPVHAREPRRCAYTTVVSKGTFKGKLGGKKPKPLAAKVRNKMVSQPLAMGIGCYPKANWKGSFTLTYKGQPVFPAFETPPSILGVTPTEGPEAGGTTVQVGGSGFTGATAVTFGSTSATSFVVNSDSSITAVAPKGSGSVEVTVTTPVATSTATPADTFTYRPAPTITEITPKTGAETGGTEVTITGTNFTSGSSVSFGATPASMVKVNSAESITAVSPPGTGTVSVTVTTAGGTSAPVPADEFTY